MTYSSSAVCMDINVFLHMSHYADAVDSCLGFIFRTCTSPDTFTSIRISPSPLRSYNTDEFTKKT